MDAFLEACKHVMETGKSLSVNITPYFPPGTYDVPTMSDWKTPDDILGDIQKACDHIQKYQDLSFGPELLITRGYNEELVESLYIWDLSKMRRQIWRNDLC